MHCLPCHPNPVFIHSHLLLIAIQRTASLGVVEFVPAEVSLQLHHHHLCPTQKQDSLLDGPLHSGVRNQEGWDSVEDLIPRAAHDVPETFADESGHGALSVGAHGVGHDALAGSAAALIWVAP